MKRVILAIVGALFVLPNLVNGASVIILDEGINTQQSWRAKKKTERHQSCSSTSTSYSYYNEGDTKLPRFSFLSLCKNQYHTRLDEEGASEYQNKKKYTAGLGDKTFEQRIYGKDIKKAKRGYHGNFVSNALYDFNRTIVHRPIQVFGINLVDGKRKWVTSYAVDSWSYERNLAEAEIPGWNVVRMLDYISKGADSAGGGFNQLTDLGAVNISMGIKGKFVSELCSNKIGADSVDRLARLGIPVVVGLLNENLPSTQESWPACLDNVINVGGLTSPGIGVGANHIDYFAKDTINNFNGNSFAAPRVAGAFALLHERFPSSSIGDKRRALALANRTKKRGNITKPYIVKGNMKKAFKELGKIVSSPFHLPDDFFKYSNVASWGPLFGGSPAPAKFSVTLPSKNGPVSSVSSSETIGLGMSTFQSLPRDVFLEFTAAVRNRSATLGLLINGNLVARFSGFPNTGNATARFVINRKHLKIGINQIEIRPENYVASRNWGVKNIRATYLPFVPLRLGIADTKIYGYNENPRYLTGLRATFELSHVSPGGVKLSVKGWDIDIHNETLIYVNGRYVGRLSITRNNSFGNLDSFIVIPSKLKKGVNYIEFIQRTVDSRWGGVDDEKWAIKDIAVIPIASPPSEPNDTSSIAPAISLLLLDE